MRNLTYQRGRDKALEHTRDWEKSHKPEELRLRLRNDISAFEKKNVDDWDEGYTDVFREKLEAMG
jgi:hypothetical protein